MTRLAWGTVGERTYQAGVDRGVLYIDSVGYPWFGLVAVNETQSGGEQKAYYVDGVKYAERLTPTEFQATIEAYTYPEQFAVCDGTKSLGNGLFAKNQRRRPFDFSYRTKIGNDTIGIDYAYKIHLVYNALAAPSDQDNTTLSDDNEPYNFSWTITTRAPLLDFAPTAHFVIDSRHTPDGLLTYIEDILYGNEDQEPRMPSAAELAYIFTSYQVTDYDAGDPDDVVYYSFDAGTPMTEQYTTTLDGGSP